MCVCDSSTSNHSLPYSEQQPAEMHDLIPKQPLPPQHDSSQLSRGPGTLVRQDGFSKLPVTESSHHDSSQGHNNHNYLRDDDHDEEHDDGSGGGVGGCLCDGLVLFTRRNGP